MYILCFLFININFIIIFIDARSYIQRCSNLESKVITIYDNIENFLNILKHSKNNNLSNDKTVVSQCIRLISQEEVLKMIEKGKKVKKACNVLQIRILEFKSRMKNNTLEKVVGSMDVTKKSSNISIEKFIFFKLHKSYKRLRIMQKRLMSIIAE